MENLSNQDQLNFDKIWLMFKETDRKFKETDKKLRKLESLFTSQWGKLIEALVEGDLIKLLNSRGIPVNITLTRVKNYYNNRQYEFDIIAENGKQVVVVEVKTTLKIEDVKEFIEELKIFRTIFPRYKDNEIIGAVAFLNADEGSDIYADKKGLFTIRATGISASITNNENFIPMVY